MAILQPPRAPENITPGLLARQGPVVTQIITRPDTTFTYVVTLGDSTVAPAATATAAATKPSSTPASTTPAGVPVPAPMPSSASGGLSQDEIGAILGSVVAFVIIVLLIWYCMSVRAQRAYRNAALGSTSSEYTMESEIHVIHDPWARRRGPTLNPAPPRFPPTPIRAAYRATAHPQFRGVGRYP